MRESNKAELLRGAEVCIFCEPLLSSSGGNLPGYIIFWVPMKILIVTSPPTYCLHIACGHTSFHIMHMITLLSSMPPKQFTWHFHWGHLHLVYFRYQVHFLLFLFSVWLSQLRWQISKRSFKSISNSYRESFGDYNVYIWCLAASKTQWVFLFQWKINYSNLRENIGSILMSDFFSLVWFYGTLTMVGY